VIPVPRSSARREAKGGRSRGGRSVRRPQRVLVVTNGEVTETEYCNLLNKEEAQKERGERSFHITCKFKPFDPKRLAEHALGIVADDKKASAKSGGGKSEPFSLVYVIVDVDNMKAENLRAAQSICRSNGMNLVISNPCMEVWLIDHEKACPPGITTAREAESLARSLGLTTGRGNKHIVEEKVCGRTQVAMRNASAHNRKDVATRRASLQSNDFAPWTDFPNLVEGVTATRA